MAFYAQGGHRQTISIFAAYEQIRWKWQLPTSGRSLEKSGEAADEAGERSYIDGAG